MGNGLSWSNLTWNKKMSVPSKVKVPCPEGVGEVLISHTEAIEPVGG